jgi:hypothetical protein
MTSILRSLDRARLPRLVRKLAARIWPATRRQWLILTLAFLFAISTLLGVWFYGLAAPSDLGPNSLPTSVTVDVFVTDPSARANLTVQVSPLSPPAAVGRTLENEPWLATIYIHVVPSRPSELVRWIIEIDGVNDVISSADRLPIRDPSSRSPEVAHVFEGISAQDASGTKDSDNIAIGEFETQNIQISHGALAVRMPDLSPSSRSQPLAAGIPVVGVEEQAPAGGVPAPPPPPSPPPPLPASPPSQGSTGTLKRPIVAPGETITNQDLVYADYLGRFPDLPIGKTLTKYYLPQAVATTDQLNMSLTDYQTLSDYPSDASLSPDSVTWHNVGELAPALTAIENGVSDARANHSFIAGVFLAIAAATLIALLQELNAMQRRRREGSAPEPSPDEPA